MRKLNPTKAVLTLDHFIYFSASIACLALRLVWAAISRTSSGVKNNWKTSQSSPGMARVGTIRGGAIKEWISGTDKFGYQAVHTWDDSAYGRDCCTANGDNISTATSLSITNEYFFYFFANSSLLPCSHSHSSMWSKSSRDCCATCSATLLYIRIFHFNFLWELIFITIFKITLF